MIAYLRTSLSNLRVFDCPFEKIPKNSRSLLKVYERPFRNGRTLFTVFDRLFEKLTNRARAAYLRFINAYLRTDVSYLRFSIAYLRKCPTTRVAYLRFMNAYVRTEVSYLRFSIAYLRKYPRYLLLENTHARRSLIFRNTVKPHAI